MKISVMQVKRVPLRSLKRGDIFLHNEETFMLLENCNDDFIAHTFNFMSKRTVSLNTLNMVTKAAVEMIVYPCNEV